MGRLALVVTSVLAVGCGRFGFGSQVDGARTDDGSVTPADALQAALIAHYTFDDDPSNGAADTSGFGHDALCVTTCPTLATGHIGSSYKFNGTSDMLRIANAADLDPAGGITVAGWVMRRSVGAASIACKLFGAADLNTWQLLIDAQLVFQVCSTADPATSRCDAGTMSLAMTTWYHVAYVWTGSAQRAYVNGTKIVDQPVNLVYDAGDVVLAADINGGTVSTYLDGWLDELQIYRIALQDADIAALAAQ